jgi:hypothetical protein
MLRTSPIEGNPSQNSPSDSILRSSIYCTYSKEGDAEVELSGTEFEPHCTENPIYVFPEMKLRGLLPKSYIHVSVTDLYPSRICLPIWLQQNSQTDPGEIYKSQIYWLHEC